MPFSIKSSDCPQDLPCPVISICPIGAITQNGTGLPVIDEDKCRECGRCVRYCPMHAIIYKS